MANLQLYDRVQETFTTTGTGTVTLLGAASGYQSFAVVGNGATCYYCAFDGAGGWEVGIGTYSTTGPTLARTTVLGSSNSGAAVSWGAGTKTIFLTSPASILGPFAVAGLPSARNLLATNNATSPTTKVDVSYDLLVLEDANHVPLRVVGGSYTINAGTTGANGLDTGTQAASTWYYLWAIGKLDGTQAGLLSTSSTSPTMPSGYAYKALLGAVYSNSSTQFVTFWQAGSKVACADTNIFTSQAAVASLTSQSLASVVPPTARRVKGTMGMVATTGPTGAGVGVAGDANGTGAEYFNAIGTGSGGATALLDSFQRSAPYNVPLIASQTVYWIGAISSGGGGSFRLNVSGWEY